jgi:RNA polymerase sigma factor (sigma-70 family)
MIKTANHEEWGDFQTIKRWRFFALALPAIATVEIFVLCAPSGEGQFCAFALLAAALNGLSADILFKRCAGIPVDEWAWEEFFRRYQQDIRAGICRVIGFSSKGRYSHLFADIMQRINLRLLENERRALRSFRGKTDQEARAFLRRVAVNIAINTLNQEEGAQTRPLEHFPSSQDDKPSRSDMHLDPASESEEYFLLVDTIKRGLHEVLRGRNKFRNILIFKLAVFDGLSPKEIAKMPGLGAGSSHAVEQQITRIRHKLRAFLKNQ